MGQKWAEKRRIKELFDYIKSKNEAGQMPSSAKVNKAVDMAKATALKHLSIMKAEGTVEYLFVGSTKLWYVAKDEKGNKVSPRITFVTQ